MPAALAALVMRCLAKRPEDRPQSAEEVLAVLNTFDTSGARAAATPRATGWRTLVAHPALPLVAAAIIALALVGRRLPVHNGATDPKPGDSAINSVAVLPFDNVGGDTANLYFADGMTEALIQSH